MESNDSPEIPDRGETSDIPGLPSGGTMRGSKRPEVCGSMILNRSYVDVSSSCPLGGLSFACRPGPVTGSLWSVLWWIHSLRPLHMSTTNGFTAALISRQRQAAGQAALWRSPAYLDGQWSLRPPGSSL